MHRSIFSGLLLPLAGRRAREKGVRTAALLALAVMTAAPAAAQQTVPLSLETAVTVAADTAPQVRISALQTAASLGRLEQARAVYFPQIGGQASVVRQTRNSKDFGISLGPDVPELIGPYTIWDFRPMVSQTLFSPAGWLQAGAAKEQVAASRARTSATAQTAALQAGQAYVNAARARATVAARQQDLALAQELLDLAQKQFTAGVGTRLDEVRAQSQVAAARAAILLAQSEQTQAEIQLARALGISPTTDFALTDSLGPELGRSAAPETEEAAVAAALENRPELTAAKAGLAAAKLGERAVSAQRYGRLALAADYGLDGPALDDMIGTGKVALEYQIPFFNGGRIRGQVHEQEAVVGQAQVRLTDLREQVAADVTTAIAALHSGEAQQTMARQQLALAEEELREARLRFGNGIAGNIEVVNAQSSLIRARDALIQAMANTALARVQLARAVGVTTTVH